MSRSWLAENRTKKMSKEEAAWLAGFFDGEGCLCNYRAARATFPYRLTLPNTCLISVKRCLFISGAGSIIKKKKYVSRHKQQWIWQVSRQKEIFDVLTQLSPYLVTKKRIVRAFLSKWRDVNAV
jgi:intein/homing endonuclease